MGVESDKVVPKKICASSTQSVNKTQNVHICICKSKLIFVGIDFANEFCFVF